MSNHIENIEITNFKSIRHQKIEGCKRINVFIGYPNVGKSAILEGISTMSYLQPDFNVPLSKLCRLRSPTELFYDGNVKELITINYNAKNRIALQYQNDENIYMSLSELNIRPDNLEVWHEHGNAIFLLGNNNFSPSYTYNNKSENIKVNKYHFQNTFNEFKTNGLTLFSPNGENLVDIIYSNKELRKEVIDLFESYGLKLNIDQRLNSIFGYKQLSEGFVYTIPFYQMADTLQRLIFHKAAILSNENAVLLFEEPEAHMFPPFIRKFTGDIIFDKGRNNQYFISTHSPYVVNDFLEDAREDLSVFLVGIKNGETIIRRLTDDELKEVYEFGVDLFYNIESYLD